MEIYGLQKTTLIDWPGKVACTAFLGGCDFRCPYCHNSSLMTPQEAGTIPEEEFFAFLKRRTELLDGVCITGGEPLLQSGLTEFLKRIKALGYLVKFDTNGNHPEKMIGLWEQGLIDYVAMDVKNCLERYAETAGIIGLNLNPIRKSVAWLLSGRLEYEFRTTVVKQFHNAEDVIRIGQWLEGANRYYLQSFVPNSAILATGLEPWPRTVMELFQHLIQPYVPAVELRG